MTPRQLCLLGFGSFSLTQCSEPSNLLPANSANPTNSAIISTADEGPQVERTPISDTDLARVCRATVATLNGHQPSIMRAESGSNEAVQVTYARPSDGKVWKNECRIEGDRVIWRTIDAFGPSSGPGRWRTHPADEVITYELNGADVSITTAYPDGSGSTENFTVH